VLLHGNEDTGWLAARRLLREYANQPLPRSLSLFIGNVEAARHHQRFLDGQPDYNRIWSSATVRQGTPERKMAEQIVEDMRRREVFASLDIHNNTGINPHYACVRRLDQSFLHLATLFGRTVVHFTKPDGVLIQPFSDLCPSVTVECGQAGQVYGVEHGFDYLRACLHLAEIPTHPVAEHDINLYHTVAIVKVPRDVSFSFDSDDADIQFNRDLDHFNFRELPAGTALGRIRPGSHAHLEVRDSEDHEVGERFLRIVDGEIRTTLPVMPSMLTLSERAIRQDCLGYFMEKRPGLHPAATPATDPLPVC
jgi:succinylglutamate desuccinylase